MGLAPVPVAEPTAEDLRQASETCARHPQCRCHPMCLISIREQALYLLDGEEVLQTWPVSTSRHGIGGEHDSLKTPPGAHRIAEKIGADAALHTVFKGRIAQDRIAEVKSEPRSTGEDCITTRILWLDGLEPGINQRRRPGLPPALHLHSRHPRRRPDRPSRLRRLHPHARARRD